MKKPIIRFEIDSVNGVYSVHGDALDETGELIPVGFMSFNYDRAKQEFDYYSDDNGFECQRVTIRK